MRSRIARAVRRRPLLSFVVLAFALSWWGWLVGALYPPSLPYVPYPILPYGPTIAAVAVLGLTSGRAGVAALLRATARWRVAPRWYLAALLLPAALYLLAVYLNVALGAPAPAAAQLALWPTLLTALPLVVVLEGGPLEEPGWRGYALPRLLRGRSALGASLLLGAVHALWHLPLYATAPENLAYVPLVLAGAVLFTWLYTNTGGSVLIAILFHGSLNTLAQFFRPMFAGADATRLFWLLAAAFVAAALVVVLATGPARLSRRATPTEARPAAAPAA
jgi:membrane protease YdiL (CAAX protease family)